MQTRPRPKGCCAAFEQAQETGTDNEGYGPLLDARAQEWSIGCLLPPIRFCPWCGKRVQSGVTPGRGAGGP